MKYDILIEKYLKEAIGDVLGKAANIGATAIKNQQGTVFDTLAKPNAEPEKELNCINTNTAKDKTWESKLGIGKLIYVRFADPAASKSQNKKQNKNQTQPPQPFAIPQTPPVGTKIDAPSGVHVWDGKDWINQNTKKPNSAPGAITSSWRKQLSQQASQQALTPEDLPYIEVQLKIQKLLGNGMFYAIIQDTQKYYSKVVQSPTTGKAFSKIDIRTPNIKVNQNSFIVLMGKGTMEPNFCFAKMNRPSKI
jgi:hypothetical protein